MSSLSQTIQDVFNEPGCGKNQGKSEKEKKKGCTKQSRCSPKMVSASEYAQL